MDGVLGKDDVEPVRESVIRRRRRWSDREKAQIVREVQRPGVYALKSDRSLMALLSDVGSLPQSAGHQVIVIRPPKEASPTVTENEADAAASPSPTPPDSVPGAETFRINLEDLRSGKPEANILLQAGDTLNIPPASQIYVSGYVTRPGSFRYQAGMTVLQALTLAGGVTERGAEGRVKIIRNVDGKKKQIKPKLTDTVEPEDTLVVPERFF